jgi:isopentenyl-diphosphate Delta-isomerase
LDHQTLLVCDERGTFQGQYVEREIAHTGAGVRHLAIAVLLWNGQGDVLLQKRKHRLFDGLWDVSGATHPLHRGDRPDETPEEATARCLEREYGIVGVPARAIGAFNYYAPDGERCENEHCILFVARYDGEVTASDDVAYGCRWVPLAELVRDVELYPERYTPWAIESVPLLRTSEIGRRAS